MGWSLTRICTAIRLQSASFCRSVFCRCARVASKLFCRLDSDTFSCCCDVTDISSSEMRRSRSTTSDRNVCSEIRALKREWGEQKQRASHLQPRLRLGELLEEQVSLFGDAPRVRLLLVSLAQHGAQSAVRRLELGESLEKRLALSLHGRKVVLR